MLVNQVYEILNTMTAEMLGDSVVVNEDLSNVVEIGRAFENLEHGVENYVRRLPDHIGRMVFVDRVYKGIGGNDGMVRDGWEYGSILEKVRVALPDADENETFELRDGASYDPNIFTAPKVSVKFFNKRVTFEVPMSITDKRVKSSFTNATQLNAFYSMIYTAIENTFTVKMDALIMRTVNAMIGETLHAAFPSGGYNNGTGVKAINLLYKYNTEVIGQGGTALTKDECIRTPEFIRYAALQIGLVTDRMSLMSTRFNVEETEKFTPRDKMHMMLLSEFKRGADVYLQSDTFHNEFTKLPDAVSVPYWQGSGTDFSFDATSKIDIVTPNGDTVTTDGILGIVYDHDAMGVTNLERWTTSDYNAKAEFTNLWYKMLAGYYIDLAENAVVFYVA